MEGGNGRNDWLHGIFLGVPSSCAPPLTWHPALHLFVCMYCVWWHLSFGRCCGIRGWRLCLVRFELWNYQVWSDAKRGRGRRETFARMSRILSSRKKMVQYRSPYDTHTESFYRFITPQQDATYSWEFYTHSSYKRCGISGQSHPCRVFNSGDMLPYAAADATTYKRSR
jgi:hypothetical protein